MDGAGRLSQRLHEKVTAAHVRELMQQHDHPPAASHVMPQPRQPQRELILIGIKR